MTTTTGFKLPTAVIPNGPNIPAWETPQNILLVDNEFAVSGGPTNVLTVGNFNHNVPQGATINNITVQIKGYRGSYNTTLQIYAVDDTTGITYSYPYTPNFQSFTGTNTLYTLFPTLFATTWTVDQVNNIKIKLIADGELHMDAVLVDVQYTTAAVPPPPTPGTGETVCHEFVQAQPFQLAQSMTSSDLFAYLTSMNYPNGDPIQIGDFYDGAILVLEQGKPGEETVQITNIEHNYNGTGLVRISFGNITNRGLMFHYPYTHDINLCLNHSGTSEVVISNAAAFYDRFLKKCQIDALVSAPITVQDEGVDITTSLHKANFIGAGVQVIADPGDPAHDVIINIPGNGVNPPFVSDTSSGTSGSTPVPFLAWSHTSSGINRGLLVQITTEAGSTITGVTYNGFPLTQLVSQTRGTIREEQWFMVAPPVGTYNIVVSVTPNAVITAGAETINAVNQSSPIGATGVADANSNNPSLVLATTVDNSLVFDGLGTALTPIAYTVGAGQTVNWSITTNLASRQGASSVEAAGTAPDNVTMDWTMTQSTDWVLTAVEICGISGPASSDEKVKVSFGDTTPGYLNPKINVHSSDGSVTVSQTITNPGGNEILDIDLTGAGGGGGGSGNIFVDQTPDNGTYGLLAGAVDGVNDTFTVSQGVYASGTLVVELNGLVQLQGASDDFQELVPGSGTFQFITPPQVGDIITVQYQTTVPASNQTAIQFEDEGVPLGTPGTVDEIDFTGGGVNATRVGNKITVNIPNAGGGSLSGGFNYLPLGKKITAGGGDGEDVENNVFANAATNRIYAVIESPSNATIRIFKNDYGTYYKEKEVTVTLAMLSLTNGTGISEVSWTCDNSYLYALVNYEKSTATTYQRIDIVRFNLDGTSPSAVNLFAQSPTVTNARNYISWEQGLSNREYRAITVVGNSVFTPWTVRTGASTYTREFREYDISAFPVVTLANTYTLTGSNNTQQAFNLRYDATNNVFYFGGLEDTSATPLIDVFTISGANIGWTSQQQYEEFGYGNNHPTGTVNNDFNISAVIDQVSYNEIYVVQQETGSSGSLGASVTSRSYRLFVYNMPKF